MAGLAQQVQGLTHLQKVGPAGTMPDRTFTSQRCTQINSEATGARAKALEVVCEPRGYQFDSYQVLDGCCST